MWVEVDKNGDLWYIGGSPPREVQSGHDHRTDRPHRRRDRPRDRGRGTSLMYVGLGALILIVLLIILLF
jgi:hypothetical protein